MNERPIASISLDADNLWSYLKTHGNPEWQRRPSYLDALRPRILDLFGRHGLFATVFAVGHDVARQDGARLVAELAAAGHEIANHSYEHEPWLHLYSASQIEDELALTEAAIEQAGVARPLGFRGPGYSLSPALLHRLAARGYEYDATTLPTWIGPLARRYYFRTSGLVSAELDQRTALFGSAAEALRPVGPYAWDVGDPGSKLVELPVTTMPLLRTPVHASYLLFAYSVNPRLAWSYLSTTVAALRATRTAPSLLIHPLDVLDRTDAPGLEFFPGMDMSASTKRLVLDRLLGTLGEHWQLGSTRRHAASASQQRSLSIHPASSAGPHTSRELVRHRLWRRSRRSASL